MPVLPCTGKSRHDGPSRRTLHTPAATHHRVAHRPDVQTTCARQSLPRKTSTPSHARECDQKTDRESPCRAAHTSPATIRPPTPREYSRHPATSSHRCLREMELRLASDDDHARDAAGMQLV